MTVNFWLIHGKCPQLDQVTHSCRFEDKKFPVYNSLTSIKLSTEYEDLMHHRVDFEVAVSKNPKIWKNLLNVVGNPFLRAICIIPYKAAQSPVVYLKKDASIPEGERFYLSDETSIRESTRGMDALIIKTIRDEILKRFMKDHESREIAITYRDGTRLTTRIWVKHLRV